MKENSLPRQQNLTGATAINGSVAITTHCKLSSISIKYSADPGAETLTCLLNRFTGSVYDVTLISQSVSGVTSLLHYPDGDLWLFPGDSLDFSQTNANGRTYGIEVVTREA